jgi:2-polyprenyl-6-methoxyphenol hydroxylase-like FAD-dependent oxidoreductase
MSDSPRPACRRRALHIRGEQSTTADMRRALNVGIVGCGIAGTATALLLAARGHRVTLFEQTPRVGPVGAGVLLQPSGQRVLAQMDLLAPLLPKVEIIRHLRAVTHTGRQLIRLPYAEHRAELHGIGLHRGDLFTLLHGRLESAGVGLLLDTRIDSIADADRRPVAVDHTGRRHGPFDLLVAADGGRSRLRTAAGLAGTVHEYAYGALWSVGTVAPVAGELFQVARGTSELAGLLPLGGGRCSLFWGLHRDAVADLRSAGFAAWRDRVLKLMPVAEPLVDQLGCLETTTFVTYRHVLVRKPWRGNVVFIGDSAHAMSPHLGQGVNLALQDAEALAYAIDRYPSAQQAFAAYTTARKWATRYYSAVTAFLTPFFQHHGTLLGRCRDLTLPLMATAWPTRRLMLRTLCGRA